MNKKVWDLPSFQCKKVLMAATFVLAFVRAQSGTDDDIPLVQKRFSWPNLPYQVDTGNGKRGIQTGYNICNATTQNQESKCQTAFFNNITDFCLWGAPNPDSVIGSAEGELVAFCTKKKYGARLLTSGAITGMQMTRTPSYIQIVGHIDQTTLNIQANDTGGEADPHGADHRGNPLGGVVYSSAFSKANTSGFVQVIEWNYFLGNGVFCFKACDPASPNAASLCEHVYDRIGCQYNMPADYKGINGVFQSCKGDDQLPVGVYEENGIRKVWKQPPESLGPITSVPYKPTIPLVSDCVTYTSSELFTETLPPAPTSVNPTAASVNKMSTPNTPSAQEAKNSGASLVPCLKRTIFFVLTMVTSYLVLAVGSAI